MLFTSAEFGPEEIVGKKVMAVQILSAHKSAAKMHVILGVRSIPFKNIEEVSAIAKKPIKNV